MIGLGNSVVKRKLAGASVPAAPVNIIQPSLSGSGAVGEAVICNKGTWSGSPTPTYTYDFRLDSVSVQNGTSNSYTPLLADDGKTLTCLVTATNSQGSASEGTSNSIVIGIAPSNTIAPTLSPSGTQSTGTVITVGNGTFIGTAPLTYSYRWKRNGSIILGETANTYTIVAGDDGTVITAEVKATNAYGESAYIGTSNQVDAVNAIAPVNTVAPVVSGTAVVGQTLSTTDGTWTGIPTPTYSYQWYRGASAISGATNNTYTLVQADAGNTSNIKCVVTATNSAGLANADSNTVAQILTVRTNSYLTLNSISDATLRGAINNVDIGIINNSLTNLRGFYFFNAGTADKAKYNFLDQRDLDAAFRITFVNTVSGDFTSNGWLPNGVSSYGNTHFIPSTNASVNGVGHGIYSRTNNTSGSRVYGCVTGGSSFLQNNTSSGTFISGSVTNNTINYTPAPSTRFLYNRRNSSTDMQAYRDGTSLGTNTNACTALPSSKFFFGARNGGSGTPDFYNNLQATIGVLDVGLTNAQALTLRTIVDNYNLECGINV